MREASAQPAATGRSLIAGFPWLTVLFALVSFLASADRFFAVRLWSVNVRFANVALVAAFVAWLILQAGRSIADVRALALAWVPFFAIAALACAAAPAPLPSALKLGWFAFNLVGVYSFVSLFHRNDAARGYFLSFLAIAAIITIDFFTGFTRGPEYMIGYGQTNDMVPGMLLYRPHAFYYEPSFAASALALAWALTLTRMRESSPVIASALGVLGVVALFVTTSRTGWLYAAVAALGIVALSVARGGFRRVIGMLALAAGALGALLLFVALAPSDQRDAFHALLGRLGFVQSFERVCPELSARYGIDLHCLEGEKRRELLGDGPTSPEESSEGGRLAALRSALASIEAHPWLGSGVERGAERIVAPPPVANLWLEIALEYGIPALVAFALALVYTMRRCALFIPLHRDVAIVVLLWFFVAWQFVQTFARLDLWLAFWVALAWTRGGTDESRHRESTGGNSTALPGVDVATHAR